jgi:hypothetical protein
MTPRKLLIEQILPALAQFKQGYIERDVGLGQDVRRGAHLAELLLNLPDYIFREDSLPVALSAYKNAREYREQYCWKQNPGYELVCDFANAWKHRKITRDGRKMNGMDDVVEAYAMCRYFDAEGAYYCGHKLVLLQTTIDTRHVELRRLLISTTAFWAKELQRLGIAPELPNDTFDFGEFTTRRDAATLPPLHFHAFVGEPFNALTRSLDFDLASRSWIEAIPGSGFQCELKLEFEVHPSPFAK